MSLFNCGSGFDEIEVTTQTNDQDTGELTVTGSLKIKGVDGVIVSIDGDTVMIGIDSETFPEDLTGGANIIVADSEEELPDPSTVPEDSIGLVPSTGSGGSLPVVELTTFITYCNEDNPSTTTTLSEAESAALTEVCKAMLPVIVKWGYDSLFPLSSLGNNLGGGHLELGAVYSSDTGAFVRGAVVRKGTTWEFRLTWTGNA